MIHRLLTIRSIHSILKTQAPLDNTLKSTSKLTEFILGNEQEFPLEHRLVHILSFSVTIVVILNGISDFILGLPPVVFSFSVMSSFVFFLIFWRSRFQRNPRGLAWLFFIFSNLAVCYYWYMAGGLTAVPIILAYSILFLIPLVMTRKSHIISALLISILTDITLFSIELIHPDLIHAYQSNRIRLLDMSFSTLFFGLGMIFLIILVKRSFQKERNRVEKLRYELEKVNTVLQEKNDHLKQTLDEIKTLQGILPICSSCKKIRNDDGYWDQLESYFTKNSDIVFSHGICEECAQKLYPDFHKKKSKNP